MREGMLFDGQLPQPKKCASCGETKSRSEFNRCKKRLDGLGSWCRACTKINKAAWHLAHKNTENAKSKSYGEQHASRIRANRLKRDREHPGRVFGQVARYQATHVEQLRQYRLKRNATVKPWRKYRADNPEKSREQCRRQQAQRWFAAKANPVSYEAVYERDNGICYLCCEPVDRKTAHFDHVIPLFRGGEHTYENIRPTHPQCNLRKGHKIVGAGAFAQNHDPDLVNAMR